MSASNGQSAAKCLSELVSSYGKSSQTSELSRRLSKLISETGDIKLYSFEDRISIKKVSGIYLLITEDKARVYVGSSKNIFERVRKHRTCLRGKNHHSKHLTHIYNKNIVIYYAILEETINLVEREHYFINYLDATNSINKTVDTLRNFYNKELINSNIKRNAKRVYVYDMTGNYINTFISTAECARVLFGDVYYNSIISRLCLGKIGSKSLKGYRFSYVYQTLLCEYKIDVNTTNANKACSKQIMCLNNGKTYDSISAACRDLKIPASSHIYKNRYREFNFVKI